MKKKNLKKPPNHLVDLRLVGVSTHVTCVTCQKKKKIKKTGLKIDPLELAEILVRSTICSSSAE